MNRIWRSRVRLRATRKECISHVMLGYSWLAFIAHAAAAPGNVDLSFAPGSGVNGVVYSIAVQSDGKILVGGWFSSVNGISRNRIARLNADGSVDTAFDSGTGPNERVYSVMVQTDGRVLIGGLFTNVNGVSRNRIARLNADGSLDATFNPGTGANGSVISVAVQQGGKVLIGGGFTTVSGSSRNRIARLNADGSLDATFNPGTGANDTVESVVAQPGDKVVIGGAFTSVNEVNANRVARLNADGSRDSSFDPGTGPNNQILSVAVQPDGKLLIGGQYTSVNGTNRNRIARLNADGSLDGSFDPGMGMTGGAPYPVVFAIAVQPDGKVLVGGVFTAINGTNRNHIARLNADGSLDGTFNPGTGVGSGAGGSYPFVSSIALQLDGKLLIGGNFTNVNGVARSHVARLLGDTAFLVFGPVRDNNDFVARFEGTPGLNYTIEYRDSLSAVSWQKLFNRTAPATDMGLGVGVFELRDPILPFGQRYYRAVYPAY